MNSRRRRRRVKLREKRNPKRPPRKRKRKRKNRKPTRPILSTRRPTLVPSNPSANSSLVLRTNGKNMSLPFKPRKTSGTERRRGRGQPRNTERKPLPLQTRSGGPAEKRSESWRTRERKLALERSSIWQIPVLVELVALVLGEDDKYCRIWQMEHTEGSECSRNYIFLGSSRTFYGEMLSEGAWHHLLGNSW